MVNSTLMRMDARSPPAKATATGGRRTTHNPIRHPKQGSGEGDPDGATMTGEEGDTA
jgi:hypothetical protein